MKRSHFSLRVQSTAAKPRPSTKVQDTQNKSRYSMNNFGYSFNDTKYTGGDIGFLEEFAEAADNGDHRPAMRRVVSEPTKSSSPIVAIEEAIAFSATDNKAFVIPTKESIALVKPEETAKPEEKAETTISKPQDGATPEEMQRAVTPSENEAVAAVSIQKDEVELPEHSVPNSVTDGKDKIPSIKEEIETTQNDKSSTVDSVAATGEKEPSVPLASENTATTPSEIGLALSPTAEERVVTPTEKKVDAEQPPKAESIAEKDVVEDQSENTPISDDPTNSRSQKRSAWKSFSAKLRNIVSKSSKKRVDVIGN